MKKVKIKGTDYFLKIVDRFEGDNDDYKTYGLFTKADRLISIKKGEPVLFTADTICHEVVHAFLYECGLIKDCDDEDLVGWIGREFLDIFDVFVSVFERMFPEFKGKFVKAKDVFKGVKI